MLNPLVIAAVYYDDTLRAFGSRAGCLSLSFFGNYFAIITHDITLSQHEDNIEAIIYEQPTIILQKNQPEGNIEAIIYEFIRDIQNMI